MWTKTFGGFRSKRMKNEMRAEESSIEKHKYDWGFCERPLRRTARRDESLSIRRHQSDGVS
jgi:hypothetical protein